MESLFSRLSQRLGGGVIVGKHAEYEGARKVWNGAIDRKPLAIVRVQSSADIAAVLEEARAAGRAVCVRGGGHSTPGHSVADDAIVIDLSPMQSVHVDAGKRTARVGGGALWRPVHQATGQ